MLKYYYCAGFRRYFQHHLYWPFVDFYVLWQHWDLILTYHAEVMGMLIWCKKTMYFRYINIPHESYWNIAYQNDIEFWYQFIYATLLSILTYIYVNLHILCKFIPIFDFITPQTYLIVFFYDHVVYGLNKFFFLFYCVFLYIWIYFT